MHEIDDLGKKEKRQQNADDSARKRSGTHLSYGQRADGQMFTCCFNWSGIISVPTYSTTS